MPVQYLPIRSGRYWRDAAACRTSRTRLEVFYPERGGRAARKAKQVCAGCSVRAECLQFALDHREEFGIWGGLTERERRRLKVRGVSGPRPSRVTDAVAGVRKVAA